MAEIFAGGDRKSTGEKRQNMDGDEVNGGIKWLRLSSCEDNGTAIDNSSTSNLPDVEKVTGISPMIFRSDRLNVTSDIIGLCDAIKAHRSLLKGATMLHRDISENNIISTGSDVGKNWRGFLIDLDLNVLLSDDKAQRKTQEMTGTMEFVALEFLSGSCENTGAIVNHSYRHDLESSFYVLLWLCMSNGWEKGKKADQEYLSKWFTGTAKEIFEFNKTQRIESNFEDDVLSKFSLKSDGLRILAKVFRKMSFLTQ
ncbi:unnamed protein product [Blumeria hordei]|uniref:Fungal-type protein kinase domain-containing protein n=1 Tax=Blumeria hordei TaxID=2867405 RepID=A0A383UPL5_BLUHO|nr:unnamed protein product [Blumeria hordei]